MSDIPLFPPPPRPEDLPKGSTLKGYAILLGRIGRLLGGLTGSKKVTVVGDAATKLGQVK